MAAVLLVATVAGCSAADGLLLTVDLRTDLSAPREFSVVETALSRRAAIDGGTETRMVQRVEVTSSDGLSDTGIRIAELRDLAPGDYLVVVELHDDADRVVVSRRTAITLRDDLAVTVLITRSCLVVECPGAGDDPAATECMGGLCVPPECSPATPDACPDPACTADSECPAGPACARARCVGGSCLLQTDDALCTDGPGGRCDSLLGCQYRTCDPPDCDDGNPCTDDACGDDGCVNAPNAVPCEDGTFCNGSDQCEGGSCAMHDGDPCPGASLCDEGLGTCTGCASAGDCPDPITGAWSGCSGFAGTCGETGSRSRTNSSFACVDGTCARTDVDESGACSRDTDGTTCMAPATGAWMCGGFASACDTTGTETRTITTYACSAGSCAGTGTPEMRACSRMTDGATCEGTLMCLGGACCTGVCGDATQDGSLTATDSTLLQQIYMGLATGTACGRRDGDVLRNGVIARGDAEYALRLDSGLVFDGCETCTVCGDADLDGDVDAADAARVNSMVSAGAPWAACAHWAGDVDGDGTLEGDDATWILEYDAGIRPRLACMAR